MYIGESYTSLLSPQSGRIGRPPGRPGPGRPGPPGPGGNGGGGGGGGGDPYFSKVVLLLHGNGTDLSTNIIDSSSYNRTPSALGNVKISTATSYFGGSSILSEGTGMKYADTPSLSLGTQDFTLEGFFRLYNVGIQQFLFGQADNAGSNFTSSISVSVNSSNKLRAIAFNGATLIADLLTTTSISIFTWYYFAFGRQGNTFRLYLGNTLEASATNTNAINDTSSSFGVGRLGDYDPQQANAYFDEIRFTIGQWRDVGTIGIPTAPFPDA